MMAPNQADFQKPLSTTLISLAPELRRRRLLEMLKSRRWRTRARFIPQTFPRSKVMRQRGSKGSSMDFSTIPLDHEEIDRSFQRWSPGKVNASFLSQITRYQPREGYCAWLGPYAKQGNDAFTSAFQGDGQLLPHRPDPIHTQGP
uniref:Uncharacterized protein n=1 Tax=Cannabis sativa TaxID=3483 RepID=A0A803Q7L8_CANSA